MATTSFSQFDTALPATLTGKIFEETQTSFYRHPVIDIRLTAGDCKKINRIIPSGQQPTSSAGLREE